MPLLDHFHPPLKLRRHWHAFHNAWATFMASDLNRRLPPRYFAEANVQFGIEIDVATFEESEGAQSAASFVGTATAIKPTTWVPPPPVQSLAFSPMSDVVEIAIYDTSGGPTLAAAIELVSPANKDRLAQRDAFVTKCLSYLQRGIGLVIVDVVTELRANLHNHLLSKIPEAGATPSAASLYATAYHVLQRYGAAQMDLWEDTLAVGQPLPVMPLWIRGGICLPLHLETTYARTLQEYKIGSEDTGSTAG